MRLWLREERHAAWREANRWRGCSSGATRNAQEREKVVTKRRYQEVLVRDGRMIKDPGLPMRPRHVARLLDSQRLPAVVCGLRRGRHSA